MISTVPVKVHSRRLGEYMHANGGSTSFMTDERDVCSIAIERGNVVVHVLHGQTLIVQAKIAWRRLGLGAEKAERSETIVYGDNNDAALSKYEAVVELRRSTAEATAVDEDHDGIANVQSVGSLYFRLYKD